VDCGAGEAVIECAYRSVAWIAKGEASLAIVVGYRFWIAVDDGIV
jgi:hypothetical protein